MIKNKRNFYENLANERKELEKLRLLTEQKMKQILEIRGMNQTRVDPMSSINHCRKTTIISENKQKIEDLEQKNEKIVEIAKK